MTDEIVKVAYNTDGVTTVFPTSWTFVSAADLLVYTISASDRVALKELTTDYTVSGGAGSDGAVTMLSAPADLGQILIVRRGPPLATQYDYVESTDSDDVVAQTAFQRYEKSSIYHTDATALVWLHTRTTTDLAEGTNLYFTDERAQDAVGGMVDTTLEYVDATPLLRRAALTGAVTAPAGSNATSLGSFTKADLDAAVSDGNVLYVGDVTQYTDENAQDAIGAMVDSSLVYVDATPLLQRAALTGDVTAAAGSNTLALDVSAITGKTADTSPDSAADYILSYDASAGALKKVLIANLPTGGGGGSPGGSDTQIQFNDSGSFGGDTGLTWDKTANTLTLGDGTGTALAYLNGAAANPRQIRLQTNGVNRALIGLNSVAETGSDAGSSISIGTYDDAGAFVDNAIVIPRSNVGTYITSGRDWQIFGDLVNQGVGYFYVNANKYISWDPTNTNLAVSSDSDADYREWRTAINTLTDWTFGGSAWSGGQPGLWYINSYTNAGAYRDTPFYIDNQTSRVTMGGTLYGGLGVTGDITSLAITGATGIHGIRADSGQAKLLQFAHADGKAVWNFYSDASDNFGLTAYDTDGVTVIDTPVTIVRAAAGAITIGGSTARPAEFTGAVDVDGVLNVDGALKLASDPGTSGQVITSNGTTASWQTPTSGGLSIGLALSLSTALT